MFYICSLIIVLSIISLPITRHIFEFVLHINISESHYIIYRFIPKFFLDRENYHLYIILYMDATICIGGTAMFATGMMLIAYLKHACAMFRIAR